MNKLWNKCTKVNKCSFVYIFLIKQNGLLMVLQHCCLISKELKILNNSNFIYSLLCSCYRPIIVLRIETCSWVTGTLTSATQINEECLNCFPLSKFKVTMDSDSKLVPVPGGKAPAVVPVYSESWLWICCSSV